MGKTRVEVKLREDEIEYVEYVQQLHGFDSRQDAIRFIIRKYRKINEALKRSRTARKALSRVLEEMDGELQLVNS